MKRQNVDVPMAVDSSDSGQDSGHLVNPFMRVTKYMTRHLVTFRGSQLPPPFTRTCLFFITLTFRAPGRNQCQHHLKDIAMLCFSMNSGIAPPSVKQCPSSSNLRERDPWTRSSEPFFAPGYKSSLPTSLTYFIR